MRVSSVIEGMGTGPDPSTEGNWPVSCSLALASAKKKLFRTKKRQRKPKIDSVTHTCRGFIILCDYVTSTFFAPPPPHPPQYSVASE